jgi:hypothetical protein
VIVTGVNMVKRHQRPRSCAASSGIIEREAPCLGLTLRFSASAEAVRVGFRLLADGRVRYCKRCDASWTKESRNGNRCGPRLKERFRSDILPAMMRSSAMPT